MSSGLLDEDGLGLHARPMVGIDLCIEILIARRNPVVEDRLAWISDSSVETEF
jgi:hypothetical protein